MTNFYFHCSISDFFNEPNLHPRMGYYTLCNIVLKDKVDTAKLNYIRLFQGRIEMQIERVKNKSESNILTYFYFTQVSLENELPFIVPCE